MSSFVSPFTLHSKAPARLSTSSTGSTLSKGSNLFDGSKASQGSHGSRDSKALDAVESLSSSGSTDTSHYKFSTGGIMYAADARAQQASGPRYSLRPFKNRENLPLSTSGKPWNHKPLIPGRQNPWRKGELPGPHRSVWEARKAAMFDVVSHDPRLGTTAEGHGKFALAEYRPNSEKREELKKKQKERTGEGRDDEVKERETEEKAGEEEHVGSPQCSKSNSDGQGLCSLRKIASIAPRLLIV